MHLTPSMAQPWLRAWTEFWFGPQDWFVATRRHKFRDPLESRSSTSVSAIEAGTGSAVAR